MLKIAIIIGSTRPGRKGETVGKWAYDIARKRNDAEFELVDIADFNLPLLDEPMPPTFGQYSDNHTRAWSAKIASFNGFVFVTPEYNHGTCAALKNAIDFLYQKWTNKAAGFIRYGGPVPSRGTTRTIPNGSRQKLQWLIGTGSPLISCRRVCSWPSGLTFW